MENPLRSYIWEFEEAKALAEEEGVIDIVYCTCMFAPGKRRKLQRLRIPSGEERTANTKRKSKATKANHPM